MKRKRLRYNRRKVFLGLFLFLCLIAVTLGYAFITTKLSIDGTATVKDAKWNVHFTNFQAMQDSVAPVDTPTVTNTSVTFSAKLEEAGDFYGFTVDVVNEGTINADISNISITPDFSNVNYIDSTIAYSDDTPIQVGDTLAAGKTKTIKAYFEYKQLSDESLYPTENQTFNVTVTISYEQYPGYLPSFAIDSWDTIKTNVTADKSIYDVGDTKTIQMDLDGDNTLETYTLRVANNTTPSECGQEGFSQTACGFVIEFQDVVTTRRMNPSGDVTINGYGTKGGWEYSDMRAYLNSTTYTADNINYSTTGIFNKLPDALKLNIIDTEVVSGYGLNDSTNFITIDKLYLFDAKEIYGSSSSFNTARNSERQLDYYLLQEITTNANYALAIKKTINNTVSPWGLRSANANDTTCFWYVRDNGMNGNSSLNNYGVSPAFRLAE